jgi:pyruvate,water dikinase
MSRPLILLLRDCAEPALVGGKAASLARLLASGFPVPPGICITAEAYRRSLQEHGFSMNDRWRVVSRAVGKDRSAALDECRSLIRNVDLSQLTGRCLEVIACFDAASHGRWAVRSSATNEDSAQASFAGMYRTDLGVAVSDLEAAVKDLWASIWEERVVRYVLESSQPADVPAMAVVIQPMLDASAAGVAYSIHPVTGRSHQVVINAVPGLAAPLVEGRVTPDQYVVKMSEQGWPERIMMRTIVEKLERLSVTEEGLRTESILERERAQASLTDDQIMALANLAKQVEQTFHCPVDVEWAVDAQRLWVLQARPITGLHPHSELTNDECEWSRANFKETMPEVPSPLGLSFLEYFMKAYIIDHYRRLGCRIAEGLSSVRTHHGRPYINVTLFHSLVGQLGGEPSLNVEQMGGEPLRRNPSFIKLGGLAYLRFGWLLLREMRRVTKSGPRWFGEMKQLVSIYHPDKIRHWSLDEVGKHLDELGRWLDRREVTFGIAAGVGQCLQTFSLLLPRWLGADWRSLLNSALQGEETVISAQQILRLADVVRIARQDDTVSHGLLSEGWDLAALRKHVPKAAFLAGFNSYLEDFGHRGAGESDVISRRFSEQPDTILDVIRAQLRGPAYDPDDILDRQRTARAAALATIKGRFGWRLDRWATFRWWFRRLCRFFALREANRHHLMYYSTAARNLLLRFGECLVERGTFQSREDVFFLTLEERVALQSSDKGDWMELIRARRAERDHWMTIQVPDTIRGWDEVVRNDGTSTALASEGRLHGLPISAGKATGPARLVRSMSDWGKVQAGDIIVAPVIDPGMAPLFGLAAGIVVEMGGSLSHGAIIAREYGLPAVANVGQLMSLVKEGDRIHLDAGSGEVRRESDSAG